MGGAILRIILLIAAITGQLQENNCDNSTTTTQTQLDSKDTMTNAKNIYAHWKQKYGATPQAAAGILGVLQLESRLDPKSVNSSSGATGLAQWLGDRKDKLEDLAHKENKPATNLGVQLDYLDQELNSSYYASNKQIFKYTDVHKATKAWLMDYEGMSKNPEQWYLGQRYGYADHWYSVLGVIVNQGAGAGNNGHTAILLDKWQGKATKIIEQGGVGDKVNESTFGTAFYSLLNGSDVTLARPIKK